LNMNDEPHIATSASSSAQSVSVRCGCTVALQDSRLGSVE
jgi:hypothetical protein